MDFDFKIIKLMQTRGKLDCEKARRLYDEGMNDYEIACACGVTRITVRNFRMKNGLISNYRKGTG